MYKQRVTYYHEKTELNVGDFVKAKVWFRWRSGRVVYVPDISKSNPNMEYNGLQWVGVKIDDGPFMAVVVDPKERTLKKTVRFLGRGEIEELSPDTDPFAEKDKGHPNR
jgi:hypothetical protein